MSVEYFSYFLKVIESLTSSSTSPFSPKLFIAFHHGGKEKQTKAIKKFIKPFNNSDFAGFYSR